MKARILPVWLVAWCLVAVVPVPAGADHGFDAAYVDTVPSGCDLQLAATYDNLEAIQTGRQVWEFAIFMEGCANSASGSCRMVGSFEGGFDREDHQSCPFYFVVGGTGHFHPCIPVGPANACTAPDTHEVPVWILDHVFWMRVVVR